MFNILRKLFATTKITKKQQLLNIKGNSFYGTLPNMKKSKIIFHGKNNIIYCEQGVILKNTLISFNGNNSIVYLSSNKNFYNITISIFNNSITYFGRNNYFNPYGNKQVFICAEGKNILVGNNNIFSRDITFRTSDGHLIYDKNTLKRINDSKSCIVGDNVWIGQDCLVLKGANIASGCVLGTRSLISKSTEANSIYAGIPAKLIRSDVYWDILHVDSFDSEDIRKYNIGNKKNIQSTLENCKHSYQLIEEDLNKINNIEDRLHYLMQIEK